MANNIMKLEALVDLAKEDSSDKRRELLRGVTDLFFSDKPTSTDTENEMFGDVLGKLAFQVEMEVRQELAMKMATIPNAPHNLIRELANDQIEVAGPVLADSGVLTDSDLVSIVKSMGEEHQMKVTQRHNVSANVSDALVEHGSDNVVVSLLENSGAELARETMERVVDRSEKSVVLQKPLLDRKDVPADLVNEMYFFVSSALKERILEMNSGLDSVEVDALLAGCEKEVTQRLTGDAASAAEQFINEKEQNRELNEKLLVDLLKNRQLHEFIVGLSRLVDVDVTTARRIILDKSCEALAIACKANRFDRSTFSTFVLLLDAKKERSTAHTTHLLDLYDKVTIETAQRTMRFWRVRKATRSQTRQQNPVEESPPLQAQANA